MDVLALSAKCRENVRGSRSRVLSAVTEGFEAEANAVDTLKCTDESLAVAESVHSRRQARLNSISAKATPLIFDLSPRFSAELGN